MNYWRALGLVSLASIMAAACGRDAQRRTASTAAGGDPSVAGSGAPGESDAGGSSALPAGGYGGETPTAGAPAVEAGAPGAGGAGTPAAEAGAPGAGGAEAEPLAGAGGGPSHLDLPAIDQQPRDRTVVEGLDAEFKVSASPDPLTYSWERSNNHGQTWSPAGSTDLAHTVPAAGLGSLSLDGDDGARFRVVVTNGAGSVTSSSATLHVLPIGAAARVYGQHPEGPTLWENDLASASGPGYSLSADLAAGAFAARSGDGEGQYAYAGMHPIRFINHQATQVVIAAGDVKLVYSGSYSHSQQGTQLATAQSTAVLSAVVSPATSFDRAARLTHQTQHDHSSTRIEELKGGAVVIRHESPTSLSAELRLPELVIPPGQSLSLSCSLQTSSVHGVSDFSAPAQLSMKLPPGISLDSSSAVPLAWVTN